MKHVSLSVIAAQMGYKMSSLQILQGTFRLSDTKTLQLPQLTLNAGDSWAFVGSNGSGKSALARALAGNFRF
ncbi:ATP-binding cassette domain-containing protein [Escherichia coli]